MKILNKNFIAYLFFAALLSFWLTFCEDVLAPWIKNLIKKYKEGKK